MATKEYRNILFAPTAAGVSQRLRVNDERETSNSGLITADSTTHGSGSPHRVIGPVNESLSIVDRLAFTATSLSVALLLHIGQSKPKHFDTWRPEVRWIVIYTAAQRSRTLSSF